MFRIWIYLSLKKFFLFFFNKKKYSTLSTYIENQLCKQSKKKFAVLTSQCRIGFLYILKYLKKKDPDKNEIIFAAYNLPEMINVAKNLNYKIVFCDIDYQTGFINLKEVIKLISSKTNSIVLTNMFNTHEDSVKLKKIASKFNITLIEDNAIYFDNFKFNKKSVFSGSLGHYTVYSFNIMKNVSSFYGGAVTTNDKFFYKYYQKEEKRLTNFKTLLITKQIFVYFVLKFMSVNLFYRYLFFKIIKNAHLKNFTTILKLIYPSLKFIERKFPKYYFTKISKLSLYTTYVQLNDKQQRKLNFSLRKKKNKLYYKKLKKINNKAIHLLNIKDFNYQNFLDFPILVNNKFKFNEFFLKHGIEVRFRHYYNCAKMFGEDKIFKNSELFEQRLICLPNHPKIKSKYIYFIIQKVNEYALKYKNI